MEDLIISKELASEVLGLEVVYIESCNHRDSVIGIWTDLDSKPLIEVSIYEFAFKCKEWALKKEFNAMRDLRGDAKLCIVGELSINTWNGLDTKQCIILEHEVE